MAAAAAVNPIFPNPPRSFAEVLSENRGEAPLSPRSFSKSFVSVVSNGGKIPVKPPGTYRGEPAVFFTKADIDILASPFRFTLIGKFSFRRPSMEIIRKFFSSLGLKSLKSIGLLQDNHVAIFITSEEDYSRLLLRSIWYVSGSPMKILKWSPDFVTNVESPIVPVWVCFPGLPLHFFDKSALFNIASVFGNPLRIDEPTANLSRPTVARVCIEMDVSKSRNNRLWLGDEKFGFWQDVVFEDPPLYCDFCKILGHEQLQCWKKNPELKEIRKGGEKGIGVPGAVSVFKEKGVNGDFIPIPVKDLDSRETRPEVGVTDGGVEEGWVIPKTKKWKRKQQQKAQLNSVNVPMGKPMVSPVEEVVPSLSHGFSSLAKGVVPRIGLALTPFNPKCVALPNISTACNNGGCLPAQIFQPAFSVLAEKQNLHFPSTLPETCNPQSSSQNTHPTSVKNHFTDKSSPTSMQGTKSGHDNLNIKQSKPLVCPVKDVQPLIGLENHLSQYCGSHEHLLEERGIRNLQEHVSVFEQDKVVSISPSCTSRLEFLGPLISDGKDLFQPLMSGNDSVEREFQPSLIASGDHVALCSEKHIYEPDSFSLPCANGDHMLNNQPLIVHNLQPQPINCLAMEIGNSFQPPIVSRGDGVVPCGLNMAPSILEEFGPGSPQDISHSSGPVLVDELLGPNAVIIVNPNGQSHNKNVSAQGSKVHLPFNIIHIQSLLLSFLADHGVVVRPPLHKALVEFSTLLENSFDDSWEVSWLFFQENLFGFLKCSGVTIPKKARRVLKFFFKVATEKNWPFTNTKGKMPVDEDMPVVEDVLSDTDESM